MILTPNLATFLFVILSTMPQYKLTYFNMAARAETARMLFKLAGVEFEDVRVNELILSPEYKKSESRAGV